MCIKQHKYYVCNCKNPKCHPDYEICCPYGPSPLDMEVEQGHILRYCKSKEIPCERVRQQLSTNFAEPCSRRDVKIEYVKRDVGLCAGCQISCADKQKGIKTSKMPKLLEQRRKEERERYSQIRDWRRGAAFE